MIPIFPLKALRGRVLVLTGAGISVASGIAPFRGQGGLYEGKNPYDLATPEAFAKHPVTVWNWYLKRIHESKCAQPNAAHSALFELDSLAQKVTIVTANVDNLHEMAGSPTVFHLHGKINERICTVCESIQTVDLLTLPEEVDETTLFRCECGGLMRPNVVWFGEHPDEEAVAACAKEMQFCDSVLEIGSSGTVSYGVAERASRIGKPVLRINPEPEHNTGIILWAEKAEVALPQLISRLRSER